MAKIIVIADKHTRDEPPFIKASVAFYRWMLAQDFNQPENTFLDLGDHFHRARPSPLEYSIFNSFLDGLKPEHKLFLRGNHDRLSPSESTSGEETNSLDPISNREDCEVFNVARPWAIGQLKCLMLPFQAYFPDESSTMTKSEYYERVFKSATDGSLFEALSSLYEGLKDLRPDAPKFAFYHFPDETQPFFSKGRGVDLSPLELVGWRLVGGDIHIHSDRYVGPPHPTRSDEEGLQGRVTLIDDQTGEIEYRPCPQFLNFERINFGDRPLRDESEGPLLLVIKNAPSLRAAHEMYGVERVWSVDLESFSEESETPSSSALDEHRSFDEHRQSFYAERGVSAEVQAVVEEALSSSHR